ncbi:MAG: efflux RND transporter periplasmic adaptor subunit, partial [Parafilimonas terrae]|nr:efflux RND transporter periplasmic adaptor subunit [Parafilimonas terrae]
MDARNPLEQDHVLARPARARRRRIWRILLPLVVLGGLGAFAALRPHEARDYALQVIEVAEGLLSSGNKDPGVDLQKAAPAERVFRPSKEQRASFEILTVATQVFRPEGAAEGRIALNDDDNVPVVSPYSGRVTKVMVRAGDDVKAGDVLLTLEATDMVQAQNDYQAALNNLQKQQALLKLDQT